MAYRRKNSTLRSSTTFEDLRPFPSDDDPNSPSSLAARAIRASAAHRDSSLSSAYDSDSSAPAAPFRPPPPDRPQQRQQDANVYEYTSFKSLQSPKYGFWDVLAKKAKAILEDDNAAQQFKDHGTNHSQMENSMGGQFQSKWSNESSWKTENPTFQKEAIASSLREFGGTIKNAFEEGLSIVENKTADIIHETKKLQIRRKAGNSDTANLPVDTTNDLEIQLNNSRNVANAVAAKAKLLLRELKTVKADFAFAKQRCTQLEKENKVLRESCQKGETPPDDELIRHQLETLLEEKTRLAHENSVYARENRFLREIVEYHQLTMQDVVYLDEGIEEVTEVYPINQISTLSSPSRSTHVVSSPAPSSPRSPGSSALLSLSIESMATPRSRNSPNHPTRIITEMEPADKEVTSSPAVEGSMQQYCPSPARP